MWEGLKQKGERPLSCGLSSEECDCIRPSPSRHCVHSPAYTVNPHVCPGPRFTQDAPLRKDLLTLTYDSPTHPHPLVPSNSLSYHALCLHLCNSGFPWKVTKDIALLSVNAPGSELGIR